MELTCSVQNYEWGEKGKKSLVAKFAHANMNINIDEQQPYAEFWIGTHPNGPSYLRKKRISLSSHIQKNPSELGSSVISLFGPQLPFLLKILSVKKALSVQVHPSKVEAEYLHKTLPNIYKDSNHKPEMAVAVTEFKALCGFREQKEIKFFLKTIPEFGLLIEKEKIEAFLDDVEASSGCVKDCFESLMLCPEATVKAATEALVARLKISSEFVQNKYHYDLVHKLNDEFPGDVGIFCIYWLNYVVLKPGEALYLAPKEPHAYLSGDCIECMANSDNVIRAGLTPKPRDVKTLCQILSYKSYHKSDVIFKPTQESEFSLLYSPPVKDFALALVSVPKNSEYTLSKRQSASLLFLAQGEGVIEKTDEIAPGMVFYLPSNQDIHIMAKDTVIMYQAFCNI